MAEEAKDLPSLANMPWWELYQDEELQRLIRIALEENKDLKRAIASIDEFQARLYTARMDFAPQLSATGNLPVARLDVVAQSYFDLRQFDMQLEIAKRTLLAWEELVRIGQARLRQGLINKVDVDQFEAEGENAAARIAELKRHMIQKENELSATL